jgi:cytochrome c biogenesis protein CcmG/thiol:disulfide interchange protein DsbE
MTDSTWRSAFAEVWRTALRHKIISGLVTVLMAGTLTGIAVAGNRGTANASGTSDGASWSVQPAGSPAAMAFSLPVLGHPAERVSLAQFTGKPLIVNFFASWCGPCNKETPMLARFYRDHHSTVTLVGIDGADVLGSALAFTSRSGVGYPVGWDPKVTTGLAYQVNGVPQTFFLNARHQVVYRVFGAVTSAQLSRGLALATR